jgi:hypothetical protein
LVFYSKQFFTLNATNVKKDLIFFIFFGIGFENFINLAVKMKNSIFHINSSLVWLMVLSFMFTNCLLANVIKDSDHFVPSHTIKKSVVFTANNSSSSNSDFPKKSSTESSEVFNCDLEDSVNNFDLNTVINYFSYTASFKISLPISCKPLGVLQTQLDIIPPPPKF